MYSLVLMMAMTSPADAPQELFPNRPHLFGSKSTGCSGTATAPRGTFLASAPVRGTLAQIKERFAERPRLSVSVGRRSTGCTGSTLTAAPAGCGGGNLQLVAPRSAIMTAVPKAPTAIKKQVGSADQPVGAIFKNHRVIKHFLAKHGVPQDQLDSVDQKFGANPIWGKLLQIFIEQGLPLLLEYLKNLLGGG